MTESTDRWHDLYYLMLKQQKNKTKKELSSLDRKNYAAALIGINLHSIFLISVHSIYWMLLLNTPIAYTVCFICILCVVVMWICVLIFNKKYKIMTEIFLFTHFGLNIHHSFVISCYLERICLYNRENSLAALLRQNGKTNMTKNRDEIVILKKKIVIWYFCRIAHP